MICLCNFVIFGSTGDSFNSEGKSIGNLKDDSFIINTAKESTTVNYDFGTLEIAHNSLVFVENLASLEPTINLLDGSITVTINSQKGVKVQTYNGYYLLNSSSKATFIATENEEAVNIFYGTFSASNGVTSLVEKEFILLEEDPVLYGEVEALGNAFELSAYNNEIVLTIPSFVTVNDSKYALDYLRDTYGPYLEGTEFFIGDSKIVGLFPYVISSDDFEAVQKTLEEEIPLVASLIAKEEVSIPETIIVKEVIVEYVVAEETKAEEVLPEEITVEEVVVEEVKAEEVIVEEVVVEEVVVEEVKAKEPETVTPELSVPEAQKSKKNFEFGFNSIVSYSDNGKVSDIEFSKYNIHAGITNNYEISFEPYLSYGSFTFIPHISYSQKDGFGPINSVFKLEFNSIKYIANIDYDYKTNIVTPELGFNVGNKIFTLGLYGKTNLDVINYKALNYGVKTNLSIKINK
ncbi:MAG: hypothetical protein HUK24_05685, partial [Sphaerochaetaceae bacterium]|nr:hypothetical protein [Sphaerochaetaceae bacterium]